VNFFNPTPPYRERYPRRLHILSLLFLCFSANLVHAQALHLRWKKDFRKDVTWYVRTSPGILLVQAGNSLTAIDGVTGKELWELPDVKSNSHTSPDLEIRERGRNMLEIPGMGVLLLNRVRLPGDSDWRLIALNLMTGKRLWEQPQADDLLMVLPLTGTQDILLVSRHLDPWKYAARMAVMSFGMALEFPAGLITEASAGSLPMESGPYHFHLIFQRVDPISGRVAWNKEYPRTFSPGMQTLQIMGDQLLLNFGNGAFGFMNLGDGKSVKERSPMHYDLNKLPLRVLPEFPDHQFVYAGKDVEAINLDSMQLRWQIPKVGKVTGISQFGDLIVAIGHESVAAVDAKTGMERWRKKTHSPTTSLLWDKVTDTILYADRLGLHSVDRATGKSLQDIRLEGEFTPHYVRRATPDIAITVAPDMVGVYNFKTGQELFTAGKFSSFFRSYAYQDHWPIPQDGQDLFPGVQVSQAAKESYNQRTGTLLSAQLLHRLDGYSTETEGLLDAYETELEAGVRKVWWIDPDANRKFEFQLKGNQHDVSRPLRMVFGVEGKRMWGAPIITN